MLFDRSKFLFVFVVLACLFIGKAETAFGQVTPPAGIIGWWAGDGDARDASGNGNNATLAPATLAPGFAIGRVGQAFNFTAQDQYISIPDSPALRLQSVTIEGWTNFTDYGNVAPTYFAKPLGFTTDNLDSYGIYYQNGNLIGGICNASSGCFLVSAPFSQNVWHHIAFTFNDPGAGMTKTGTLYIDGVSVSGTTNLAISYDTTPAYIGADYDRGAIRFSWRGILDEVSLYNRALSASEIQAIYNAGINGKTKQAATNAGANLQTVVNDATITFANVSTPGTTTDYTIDPTTAGTLPAGYTQTGLAYDISTTAAFSGLITECFHIPSINDATVFSKLKVLHSEAGTLVDKTISNDFANRLVCGRTTSLSPFVIANGLAPTAASVAIGGRVTVGKRGLAQARVTLTDMNGETRYAMTNSFGYYRFDDVAASETYIFTINHKRYSFAPQVINVTEDLTELNFTAEQ